ncbi:hypothetical protein ACIPWE_35505 [Streptomyces sp. NPDC090073]
MAGDGSVVGSVSAGCVEASHVRRVQGHAGARCQDAALPAPLRVHR